MAGTAFVLKLNFKYIKLRNTIEIIWKMQGERNLNLIKFSHHCMILAILIQFYWPWFTRFQPFDHGNVIFYVAWHSNLCCSSSLCAHNFCYFQLSHSFSYLFISLTDILCLVFLSHTFYPFCLLMISFFLAAPPFQTDSLIIVANCEESKPLNTLSIWFL